MGAFPHTIRWIVLTEPEEAMTLLGHAAHTHGFRSLPPEESEVIIEVPRSLFKRRPGARLAGSVTPTRHGTEIIWTCGDDKHRASDYLLILEESLPAGALYYHGMAEAAVASGVLCDGKRDFRSVVDHLGTDELMVAIARGKFGEEAGIVALTDRRLLFVKSGAAGSAPLIDSPLDAIGTPALGKKSTGETLRILPAPATVVISHLGHGEGHSIVAKFRELMKERARTPAIFPIRHTR